jgi:hypothetical protein
MQCTADFHHHAPNPGFPHPKGLFQRTTAFHTAVDMFDAHAPLRDFPIPRVLGSWQRVPAWLLRGWDDLHPVQRERLKAQVLQQLAPGQHGGRRGVGDTLVMDPAGMCLTQEEDAQGPIDQQEICQYVPLVLAEIPT